MLWDNNCHDLPAVLTLHDIIRARTVRFVTLARLCEHLGGTVCQSFTWKCAILQWVMARKGAFARACVQLIITYPENNPSLACQISSPRLSNIMPTGCNRKTKKQLNHQRVRFQDTVRRLQS